MTLSQQKKPELLFLFSVDTEAKTRMMRDPDPARAVHEHIFCRTADGSNVGIDYMMDRVEKYGGKATFFVDILQVFEFGETSTRQAIDLILTRGHDVQLHLHPSPHLRGAEDQALRDIDARWSKNYSPAAFRDALDLACTLFERYVGEKPLAFRNGAYHLEDAYFPILAEYGLLVDSSLYPFKNCRVSDYLKPATLYAHAPSKVLELPVGWFGIEEKNGTVTHSQYALKLGRHGNYFCELIRQSETIFSGHEIVPLTCIAHSYSLLKQKKIDSEEEFLVWNARLKNRTSHTNISTLKSESFSVTGEPFQERIASLHQILEAVADAPSIRFCTFKEIRQRYYERLMAHVPGAYTLPVYNVASGTFRTTAFESYSSDYAIQHYNTMK